MGILLTLEHGEQRAVIDVGSTDRDCLILFSQKELRDVAREVGRFLTTAEVVDLQARAKFGKQVACVIGYRKEEGRPTRAGELRAAAEELLDWCKRQGEFLPYVYLANHRPMPTLDYNGFSKGMFSARRINGELWCLDTGLGLCELQRVVGEQGGWCKVVERRDLRGEVAKGLDRIATDDHQDDVLLKRRKVALKLPSILKSVAEFAAQFPPEDTIMVSCRHPPGKKRRNEEEEEGDL